MDTVLDEGKSVPFSNKLMVDVEELKRIIEDIRLNMPTEITQAKKIATERRDILNAADAEAEDILAKARQKADLMVEEHQITRDIMDKAEKWSGDMRRNASNYVESIIRDTDETLTKSVNDIRQLRQSVRDALGHTSESRPNIDL